MSTLNIGTITQAWAGSTCTLTFTAAHDYGIQNVHWTLYAANGTTIQSQGEAAMTWSMINTTYNINTVFNNTTSYMNCTVTIPNAVNGRYVILDFYTILQQRASKRVQLLEPAGTGVPAIPADVTPALTASRVVFRMGFNNNMAFGSPTNLDLVRQNVGFIGYQLPLVGNGFLAGPGGGGNYEPVGYSVLNESPPDPRHDNQRLYFEGPTGIATYKKTKYPSSHWEFIIRLFNANFPTEAWGDWWNDTLQASVAAEFGKMAACCKFLGGNGFHFDPEGGGWEPKFKGDGTIDPSFNPNHHPEVEHYAKIEQRGYECGLAAYTAFPDLDVSYYGTWWPGEWPDHWSSDADGSRVNWTTTPAMLWIKGWLRAGAQIGGNSHFRIWDAWDGYRGFAFAQSPRTSKTSMNTFSANRLEIMTMHERMSQFFTEASWNHWGNRFNLSYCSWAGCDRWRTGTPSPPNPLSATGVPATMGGYGNNQQIGADFAAWHETLRLISMGGIRFEYALRGGEPAPFGTKSFTGHWAWKPGDPLGTGVITVNGVPTTGFAPFPNAMNAYTDPPGRAAALVAACNPAPVDNIVPTITTPVLTRSGTTVTITAAINHQRTNPAGHGAPRCLGYKLYAANGSTIEKQGFAKMVFNPRGGSYTTGGFPNATLDCTITLPNAVAGRYVILTAESAWEQKHSVRVQLP